MEKLGLKDGAIEGVKEKRFEPCVLCEKKSSELNENFLCPECSTVEIKEGSVLDAEIAAKKNKEPVWIGIVSFIIFVISWYVVPRFISLLIILGYIIYYFVKKLLKKVAK